MRLSTIAHVTAFAGILVACSAGGSGTTIEGSGDPGGPFSGMGNPGSSIYGFPGPFVGSGGPGIGGSREIDGLLASVCTRVNATCPATSAAACVASFQSGWDRLTTDCARALYYSFMTCLLSANITCGDNGQATTNSCLEPPYSQCSGTTGGTDGGNTGGAGGTGGGTGGTGGGTGGTGGGTGGTGGTGGRGGTGGGTGGTGGTGGGTGGTGGGGTAGTGGTGGRGPRDGGRG